MYRNRASNDFFYKSKLSDFGKNVLETLMRHKQQEPQVNLNRATATQQAKDKHTKIKLSFGNSSIVTRSELDHDLRIPPPTITRPDDRQTEVASPGVSDSLTSTTNHPQPTERAPHGRHTQCNQICEITLEKDSESNDKIDWNDMFDHEFIQKTDTKTILAQNNLLSSSSPKIDIKANKSERNKQSNNNKVKPKTDKVSEIKKPVKRLQEQLLRVADTTESPDRPNINAIKLVKSRKETYNKTVQNWLKDINKDVDAETNKITITEIIYNKQTSTGKENNKKVIQTCLVNKGGTMKYDKPKIMNITSEIIEQDKITEINENAPEIDKKRQKFTPPLKCVKSVKHITTYNVIQVDEHNYNHFTPELGSKKHGILVLVYENGFSQLNEQYTDAACVPEGVLLHVHDTQVYYYWNHKILSKHTHIREYLNGILTQIKIVCYEGKKLLIYLLDKCCLSIDIHKLDMLDVKIGASLIDSEAELDNFGQLQKLLSHEPASPVVTACPLQKCAWYAASLDQCAADVSRLIQQESLHNVFTHIEMPLLPIIADMERRGVCVDLASLTSMEAILINRMRAAEAKCYEAAGKRFQINSALQVGNILYDQLQLHSKINVKIQETVGKGARSTSEPVLRSLMSVHPLPKHILEYRHLHKAYATFLAGISQHVQEGVVRATWIQIGSATGRIASASPNLQAIPKAPFLLQLFPDQDNTTSFNEQDSREELLFRSIYVSRAGYWLLAADFQHIECRVFAHRANDRHLLDIFRQNEDFFKLLASKWLNKSADTVTAEERERSKRMVYANLYGAGTNKLMHILELPYHQTLAIVTSFNRTFPSLKEFGREVVRACAEQRLDYEIFTFSKKRSRSAYAPTFLLYVNSYYELFPSAIYFYRALAV